MTPREKTVLRAVSRALSHGQYKDMDALATSLPVTDEYFALNVKQRAAAILTALVEHSEG